MNLDTSVLREHKAPLFSKLRTRLLLLVLILMIPTFGLIWLGNLQQRRLSEEAVRDGALAISKLAASNQERFIENTRQLLSTLAEFPFLVLATNRALCERHFQNLRKLSPDYLNFGLIEKDGSVFGSAAGGDPSVNLADRSYFQRAVQTKRFAVGDFQTGRLTGEPALNFGYPIFSESGEVTRVLFASLKASVLSEAVSRVPLPLQGAVTIIDRSGSVLARYPGAELWVGRCMSETPFVQWVLSNKGGVAEIAGMDGVRRLYAVTVIMDGRLPDLFVTVGLPLAASFARAERALIQNSTLMLLVGVCLFLGARLYAGRFVLRPIQSLASAANRLASGDLKARAGLVKGAGELNQLAHAFDSMAETLEKRQVEVEQANAEVSRANAQLEERVKARTAELAAVNQELEAFSYSVSHDLRAPLRHIDGFVGHLAKSAGNSLDSKSQRYLKLISDAAKDMGRLIDDLLIFARMGRVEMRSVEVELKTVVESAMAALREETQGRNLIWNVGQLPTVLGDVPLLRQVFINLLSNAVKYTRPRQPAEIEIGSAAETPDEFVVFVRDNGVGFEMEYANKLFGVFQRLHRADEFEGTGIGLANVRRVIQRHGGRTWAEGKVEGGATFYFSIPKGKKDKHGSAKMDTAG